MITVKATFECDRCHVKREFEPAWSESESSIGYMHLELRVPGEIMPDGLHVYWRRMLDADLCPKCYSEIYKFAHTKP